VESNESMTCPICSDGVNVRFMDPVLMTNGTRKWVCSECGLERFEYHKENSPTEFR
jgi:ribosomal protein S27AE